MAPVGAALWGRRLPAIAPRGIDGRAGQGRAGTAREVVVSVGVQFDHVRRVAAWQARPAVRQCVATALPLVGIAVPRVSLGVPGQEIAWERVNWCSGVGRARWAAGTNGAH